MRWQRRPRTIMETEPTTEQSSALQTQGESALVQPPIVRRRTSSQLLGVATLAALAMGGPTLSVMEFPRMPKGPTGRGMKRVGKTESGDDILEDHEGRQYTRNSKGTIRRYKANTKLSDAPRSE